MGVNKVTMNGTDGERTLIDLTGDTVKPETLARGATAHDASGEPITGTMPTENVLYIPQTLTAEQQAQARANIGAMADGQSANDALTHRRPLLDGYYNVKAIAHRGLSADAPENTLPAYVLAKSRGFNYVEADISFTSDGVPVLLHDSTIDRTSTGTGTIWEMTYAQAAQYDYGSWFSTAYAGTKIPTFAEFLQLCKDLGLHPYIEIKQSADLTDANIRKLVDIVREYGMEGKVSWISFSSTKLGVITAYDPFARCGYLAEINDTTLPKTLALKTGLNEVFFDVADYVTFTDAMIDTLIANDLGLEVWTIDDEEYIKNMHPFITGVTSNSLIAGDVLVRKHGIVPDNTVPTSEEWTFTLEDGTTVTKQVMLT